MREQVYTYSKNPAVYDYTLNNTVLSRKEVIKYLGLFIDNKLTFKYHIEQKCQSATRVLNLLRRNLYFAPKSVKNKAYFSCVLPIIEYGSNCWSPSSDKMNNKIEMVQHSAAKFACNSYPRRGRYEEFSITSLLESLQWESVEHRRNKAKLNMAYKMVTLFSRLTCYRGPSVN